MSAPIWIEKPDCLAAHEQLLARSWGHPGIRSVGLLDEALAAPQRLFCEKCPSHFELAATYAHGIVKNRPFFDGNLPSGLMAAVVFLEINGFYFQAPEEEAVLQTLALAAGEGSAGDYAAWLARSCSPRQSA